MEMNAFLESFNRVCAEPFANYYNETTMKAVVIALIVYATALLMTRAETINRDMDGRPVSH